MGGGERGAHAGGGQAPGAAAAQAGPVHAPLLRFENVSKEFGPVRAVDDVSLDLAAGELFCLIGPSGCGKTTLMRMLAGFETPTSGRILLEGQDISAMPPYRRPINMMFQSYALFPHLSVAGNIAFGLQQEGLPRPEIDRRVGEMLDLVQLRGLAARKPAQLSGGQRQRVALARAVAKRPKILLLDEPLAALDRKLREETQFELMALQASLGMTFLLVTHDQDEAMTMAHRIGVMERGKLLQTGHPRELYEHPAHRSVAAFLGGATFFEGRLTARDGDHAIVHVPVEKQELVILSSETDSAIGATVWLAVRPEKMALRPTEATESVNNGSDSTSIGLLSGNEWRDGRRNRIDGVLEDCAYLGDLSVHNVRLASGALARASRPNAARGAAECFTKGQHVSLLFPPEAVMVFPA